jgi:hypothetical protein
MTLNSIQLLPHLGSRHIRIEQMALSRPTRDKSIVFIESLDMVIGVSAEQHPIRLSVNASLLSPEVPDPIAERIHHERILGTRFILVKADVWTAGVGRLAGIVVLRGEES